MQKSCKNCGSVFEVTDDDLVLLKKLTPVIGDISYPFPSPSHCPQCRQARRMATRNERNLYWRICDLTGEKILSLYPPDSPYTIYSERAWWSDDWDAEEYGRTFDFSRPFFEQFSELRRVVPRRAMNQDGTNENCEYTTMGLDNKNCYLTYGCVYAEDVYLSTWTYMAKNCVDCLMSGEGEILYECVDCTGCYHCFFCHDCEKCTDVYLSEDCRNCKNCICCKNLRHKEYHIYNKPVSQEEFEQFFEKVKSEGLRQEWERFLEWRLQFPFCYAHIRSSENSTGDYLDQTKNCRNCFDIVKGAEDCAYVQFAGLMCKDLLDCCYLGINAELLYEVANAISGNRSAFLNFCKECSNCLYCDTVRPGKYCFGCSGLKHKEYCVLNKQYSKEEYEELVPKIIEHMKQIGEWGEFFPISLSPFAYNETLAQDYFPLTESVALEKGYRWKEEPDDLSETECILSSEELPSAIADVTDDIVGCAIRCPVTDRLFRIFKQELAFYREHGLSLPRLHPEERHIRRIRLRNKPKFYDRTCDKCGKGISTTYAPERPETVYCEDCYRNLIY